MKFFKSKKVKYLFVLLSVTIIILGFISLKNKFYEKYKIKHNQIIKIIKIIPETFLTKANPKNNIDSVAIWHGSNNQNWLLATAKSTNKIIVYDAQTGEKVKSIGTFGNDKMQFARPNSVAVINDFAFIVERDNHRLQVFSLPEFNFLGFIGENKLKLPYGLTLYKKEKNTYILYVTDNYDAQDETKTNGRVHHYEIKIKNNKLSSKLLNTFGYEEKSFLRKVETIVADKKNNRLFIADESPEECCVKIYTLDGKFTGKYLGKGLFKSEPEGIAIYKVGKNNGYIIATNQDYQKNTFFVFDRKSLQHLGTFNGKNVSNTDGIAVTSKSFGPFKNGAFYAVNNDKNVAAISWANIKKELKLP